MEEKHRTIIPGDEFVVIPFQNNDLVEEKLIDLKVKVISCNREKKTFTVMFTSDVLES